MSSDRCRGCKYLRIDKDTERDYCCLNECMYADFPEMKFCDDTEDESEE